MRRLDVRDPVADRLARRFLQRALAELDGPDLGAEQVHALDVGPLPAHVLLAHVDDALEAEAGADGCGRDAMLAGAGFGDDSPFAQPARQDGLAERVVQLVRAGVQQVLAFEIEPLVRREAFCARERRRSAREGPREHVELRLKGLVRPCAAPAILELVERGNERLGHVAPAVRSVQAGRGHRAASTKARTLS